MVVIERTLIGDLTNRLIANTRTWIDDGQFAWTAVVASINGSIRCENRTDVESGTRTSQTLVLLPFVDIWAPADVMLFSASAILFRIHVAFRGWSERRRSCSHRAREEHQQPPPTKPIWSPPKQTKAMHDNIVKATVIHDRRYKDQGLQRVIEECKEVKKNLRKVDIDPDVVRKGKCKVIRMRKIRQQQQQQHSWAIATKASTTSSSTLLSPSSPLSSSMTGKTSLSPSSSVSSSQSSFAISPETLKRARLFLGTRQSSSYGAGGAILTTAKESASDLKLQSYKETIMT